MSARTALLCLLVPVVLSAQQAPQSAAGADLRKAEQLAAEGRSAEAVAFFRSWLEANPGSAEFGNVLLRAAAAAPQTAAALALLAEYGPRVADPAQRAECLQRRLELLALLGRTEEALALAQAQPSTSAGWLVQAAFLYELGELREAEQLLAGPAQAADIEPQAAARRQYLLALIYAETGRFAQAEAAFRTLQDRYADAAIGPAVLLALREFQLRRGNETAASEAERELRLRYPASPECALLSGSGSRVKLAPTPARLLSGLHSASGSSFAAPDAEAPGTMYVQAGSFRDRANAADLARDLKAGGLEARVAEAVVREVRYYRVIVGPRQTPAQAQQTLLRLKEAGFEGILIPAD